MIYRFRVAVILMSAIGLSALPTWAATTVNYQGHLYNFNGAPVNGGLVIAGTFAAGFNPANIACAYGDSGCNIGTEYYRLALTDGKLFPIGTGASTDSTGFFSGTGMTSDPAGTPIYLFGFRNPSLLTVGSDGFGVLGSSSDASYRIPVGGGPVSIDAALANVFVFGQKFNGGIEMNILPFPEPSSVVLAIIGVASVFLLRRR